MATITRAVTVRGVSVRRTWGMHFPPCTDRPTLYGQRPYVWAAHYAAMSFLRERWRVAIARARSRLGAVDAGI